MTDTAFPFAPMGVVHLRNRLVHHRPIGLDETLDLSVKAHDLRSHPKGRLIDITTTEICDLLMGGVFPATEDRFGAIIRTRTPYIGSVGALDMVNFRAPETVPERYAGRQLYRHNPQVTLMRTTPDENERTGRWIGDPCGSKARRA